MPAKVFSLFAFTVPMAAFFAGAILGARDGFSQSFTLTFFGFFDHGGGISSGGAYSVRGVISPASEAKLSGGVYAIKGAISETLLVPETPDSPELRIRLEGAKLVISWSAPLGGFELQEAVSISDPVSWKPVVAQAVANGAEAQVTLNLDASNTFLRLKSR